MSVYDVRFIREAEEPDEKHVVIEITSDDWRSALDQALSKLKPDQHQYNWYSVEIKKR